MDTAAKLARLVLEVKRLSLQIGGFLLRFVSLLLGASILAFVLVDLSPVDPVQQYVLASGGNVGTEQREAIAAYWGVGEPPVQRYFHWLNALLHGDLGTSLFYRQPVSQVIRERFANTFALMATSWLLAGVIGYLSGVAMGLWKGSLFDRVFKKICLVMASIPTFWLGMLLLMVFSAMLGWFPIGFSGPVGMVSSDVSLGARLHHLVLPALTLALVSFSPIALHTRQKMIDVMQSEFVTFSTSRGDSTWDIVRRHGIRNTLLPAMTLQFASFGELFGGSILAETVFSYPGLGSAVATAGLNSDVPLLLGITIFATAFVFTGNQTANYLYKVVDPRIREAHG